MGIFNNKNAELIMFALTEKERAAISEFIAAKRVENTGAIGGQFTWSFTPTSIGCVVEVTDSVSGESLDATDYDEW